MKILPIILILTLLPGLRPCYSQSNYEITGDHSLIIKGSSNIRDWSQSVEDVEGVATVVRSDSDHFDVHEVKILIRTTSIKSIGIEGNEMDKKTYETLKADQYPTINLVVTTPLRSIPADAKKRFQEINAVLTVAGTEKSLKLHSSLSADKQGEILAEGEMFLRISDFHIRPPVTLFGLLRVKDDISIRFRVRLIPANN